MQTFVRIEGVNIGKVMDDTDDISVIRGASFMLKESIQFIAKRYVEQLEPITTGASEGIFKLRQTGKNTEIVEQLRHELSHHDDFKYLTFAIVSTHAEQFDTEVKKRLLALSRLQQIRQLTQVAPARPNDSQVCNITGLLMGETNLSCSKKESYASKPVSESVEHRREYGMKKRQAFYTAELGGIAKQNENIAMLLSGSMRFTDDLHELAKANGKAKTEGKLAIIYLDGNSFGGLQEKILSQEDEDSDNTENKVETRQKAFDHYLQAKRAELMGAIVQFLVARTATDKLPLETLMWGGDEMLLVVPAIYGIEVMQLIYEQTETWDISGHSLKHAGGIVFCQYKSPIFRVRKAASQLAELIKKSFDKSISYFDYLVLESLDCPVEIDDGAFWCDRYGPIGKYRPVLKSSPNWYNQLPLLRQTMQTIPRSQAYQIAKAATHTDLSKQSDSKSEHHLFNAQRLRAKQVLDEPQSPIVETFEAQVADFLGLPNQTDADKAWIWLHAVELWDYLSPLRKEASRKQQGVAS